MKLITETWYDIEYVDYKAKPEEYYEIHGARVISKSDGTTAGEDGCWKVYLTAEVCTGCNGTGKHVHRGIDGNGLSEEDRSDPDFMEDYLSGAYDVTCETCNGLRVVFAPDWKRLEATDPALADAFESWEEFAQQDAWASEQERRYGA